MTETRLDFEGPPAKGGRLPARVAFTPREGDPSRLEVTLGRFHIGDVIVFERGYVRLLYRELINGKPDWMCGDWPSLDALTAELEGRTKER